jgi:DNA-binding NarL/FixJ family response regulator
MTDPTTTDLPEPGPPARVLIVDDVASTRQFLRAVLESSPQFDVVGEAGDGATAVESARTLEPDVVLLDVYMPETVGSSALEGLRRVAPSSCVIIVSGIDRKGAAPFLAAGARAFLPKGLRPYELLHELGKILDRPILTRLARPTSAESPAAPEPLEPTHLRAVICDDDAMTRQLVAQVLARCEVPVIAETDVVPNLISVIVEAKPEIVVLDLWLEGVSGTSALPSIRSISPGTQVIVYSAVDAWAGDALAAGAAAFVSKPHFTELEATIRRLTSTLN